MKQLIILLAFLSHLVLSACAKTSRVSSNPPGSDTTAGPATPAPAVTGGPNGFKGFNWADSHDNYSDTVVVPSGLSSSDDYATVQAKADLILSAFSQRGVNTIRLPVNPYSVAGNWWKAYAGAIDKALDKGMRVVLAYWEGTTAKDGLIDDTAQYWRMWQSVTTRYAASGNVWFEPFNEPFGYSVDNLKALYAQWLARFPAIPAGRVLLDGTGYATGVNEIGADSRFAGCLLSFHMYTWFQKNRTTVSDWEQTITSLAYPGRTILSEFGVPMTNGKDYLAAPGSDVEVAYLQGLTNALRARTMGSVYWPGLRIGDSYSMLSLSGTTLATNSTSGLARLQYAWGN
ncbi:cellulase family glycosylhydrolase [Puia dinghuensis]|uniref:Cellulase n=1 Tax=Puia dinghuensis TaxID=1792502 RepID=A0A8J2UHX6_9BACT|nr:cellulase family glycosylhydrolase [Puia dinghuensis]GGB20670.1 cellulase [Puia dinghuensis]